MRNLCDKYRQPRSPSNKGFFLRTSADMSAIEDAFRQVAARIPVSQTFELDGTMSDEECRAKLEEHRPDFISPENKLLCSFWVNFLFRRISVFDQNEDFNYNEKYEHLGSSLMEVMLSESEQLLKRVQNSSWSSSNHSQLIYDFSQEDSPRFGLICTSPEKLDADKKERFNRLDLPGFKIPTTSELRKRETLDRYLSQALGIRLTEGPGGKNSLQCIDDNRFVLTLDFTLKLLNIHERVACGVPCVMEGETGVSKTALTRMYSILANSQQHSVASASTAQDLKSILRQLSTMYPAIPSNESADNVLDEIRKFLQPSAQHLVEEANQAIRHLIDDACSIRDPTFAPIPSNLLAATGEESTKELLLWFASSQLEPTFFDINIHGSLSTADLKHKFDEARRVAKKLLHLGTRVVVFLDEINTSSILGLLKEVIVDRSLSGEMLEDNIVVIAACNPPRQRALSQEKPSRDIDLGRDWVSGHYQVHKLPLSLVAMTWDFGALCRQQEREFIRHRIMMTDGSVTDVTAREMTEVISCSHETIRSLAQEHARSNRISDTDDEAERRARSVVSLRDIQRVFHFIDFFLHECSLLPNLSGASRGKNFREAMLLAVGITYYLRLDRSARTKFAEQLQSLPTEQFQECYLEEVLESAMDAFMSQTEAPEGIALTRGLKENVWMAFVCTLARVPLMIIGPPGCSKTLAVNIVTDNAKGEESPAPFFRDFPRLQPFHFQCSRSSNSLEIESVFSRANQRQKKVNRSKQQCLVFMDEAGLPEEEKESLKVLHYLLEGHMSASPDVGFVVSMQLQCLGLMMVPQLNTLASLSRNV